MELTKQPNRTCKNDLKMNINLEVKKIIYLFIAWRSALFIASLVIISLFDAPNPRRVYGEINILKLWSNWDGGHYIGIALNGYAHINQYAFFPLYPILIKLLNLVIPDPYKSALIISNAALLGVLIALYKLSLLYGQSRESAFKTVLILLIFPSAFFLGAAYAESLLLFFTLISLILAKKKYWFPASIFAGLACFTKFIAVVLLAVLVAEYLTQKKVAPGNILSKLKTTRVDEPIVYLFLFGPFGIYLYSLYSFWETGYWFFFRDAQMHWGRSLTLLNPFPVLQNSITQNLLDMRLGYLNFSVHSLETLAIILFVFLLPMIYRRFGFSLTLYTFVVSTFTLYSGKVDSGLRYVLAAFPAFMLFGELCEKYPLLYYSFIFLFSPLLGILLILFLTGNWAG